MSAQELHWYHDNWFDVNRAQPSSLGGASVASELSRQLRGNIPSQLQSSDSLILTDQRSNFAMGGGTGGCSMHTLVLNSDDDCDINRCVEYFACDSAERVLYTHGHHMYV